jgi:hypothetical protein
MTPVSITEKHVEALTVARALAPGVYVRNRMFDLFAQPGVQRARMRASILRGVVPQLARATAVSVATENGRGGEPVFVLRYSIAEVRLHRVVELSATELAALRLMAARARVTAIGPEGNDRALVDVALARLLDLERGGAASEGAGEKARDSVRPPPPDPAT